MNQNTKTTIEKVVEEISENYGLQELMLHVLKMKLVIQNS